jgi:hypothetical protein
VGVVSDDDEDFFDKQAQAEFASAVIELFKYSLGQSQSHDQLNELGDRWPDVYKVGIGLAVLQALADRQLDELLSTKGLMALRESRLREAIALLDALTTGKRHPIFDHVDGLRSKKFRPIREKPNEIDRIDMHGILAGVRALMAAREIETGQKTPESKAIRDVISVCGLVERFQKPQGTLEREVRDRNRRATDKEPDTMTAKLLKEVESIPAEERLKKFGAAEPSKVLLAMLKMWADEVFSIPSPPRR